MTSENSLLSIRIPRRCSPARRNTVRDERYVNFVQQGVTQT